MPAADLATAIASHWDDDIVAQLTDYVRIPAKSPHFDPDWKKNGHIDRVIALAEAWVRRQKVRGLELEIVRLKGRTPLLFFDVPASGKGAGDSTVVLYGHLDKQPEMTGWHSGAGPWIPRFEDGKLYGRGSADDGYAVFASLAALAALDARNLPHARCVGIIETCEESGSYDLPAYLEHLAPRLGKVDLVIGLDSGCGDYERLWATASLRGIAAGTLTVDVLTEGVHSGDASGIVPSSFRIARNLLDRLEDSLTGRILPSEFHMPIPEERVEQARAAADIMGELVIRKFPFAGDTKPMVGGRAEAILNRTWRPALSVIGADGRRQSQARQCAAAADVLKLSPGFHRHSTASGRPPTCSVCSKPIRRTAPSCTSNRTRRPRGGMHRRRRRGSRKPSIPRHAHTTVNPRRRWVRAERSRSWGCWAGASRRRNSSSPASSARIRTPTVRTNSSTCRTRKS